MNVKAINATKNHFHSVVRGAASKRHFDEVMDGLYAKEVER
jgi:hypothetical protein